MLPRNSFAIEGADQQVGMVLYAITSFGIATLGGMMHRERRSAQASTQSERRQANLIDQSYDAVFVWTWNGPITFWNQGAERIYGFLREEALGRVSHELLKTARPDGVKTFLSTLDRQGFWEGELEHTKRDGRKIFVETRMVLVRDKECSYVLEANRDITQRRTMEQELNEANARLDARVRERTAELSHSLELLQAAEERFRLLIEGVQEYAIFMLDLEGRVLTWNAGAERNKGYRAEEIIGRHFSCFYPQEDIAQGRPEQQLRKSVSGRS